MSVDPRMAEEDLKNVFRDIESAKKGQPDTADAEERRLLAQAGHGVFAKEWPVKTDAEIAVEYGGFIAGPEDMPQRVADAVQNVSDRRMDCVKAIMGKAAIFSVNAALICGAIASGTFEKFNQVIQTNPDVGLPVAIISGIAAAVPMLGSFVWGRHNFKKKMRILDDAEDKEMSVIQQRAILPRAIEAVGAMRSGDGAALALSRTPGASSRDLTLEARHLLYQVKTYPEFRASSCDRTCELLVEKDIALKRREADREAEQEVLVQKKPVATTPLYI